MLVHDPLKISQGKPFYRSGLFPAAIIFFNIVFRMNVSAGEISVPDSGKIRNNITLLAFYQQGMVMPTNSFVRGNNLKQKPISSFRAISFQLLKQTNGKQLWEQLYNYPRYGIGIYSSQIIHTSELGDPFAIYGIMSVPQVRRDNFLLYTEIGAGIAFNWVTYFEDKYNIANGGEMTAFAHAGIYLEYKINKNLFADAGISVNHYSNGALIMPNLGINKFAPKISLGYNFINTEKEFKYQDVPDFQRKSECLLSIYTGWENRLYNISPVDTIIKEAGFFYNTYGLSVTFNRHLNYLSKFGVGFTVDYLGAANRSLTLIDGEYKANKIPFREGFELSIFPSYELIINKLSVIMQSGFYLYRFDYPFRTPLAYQRVGLKYNVINNISLGIHVRAHNFSIADYIEWTVAYRLQLRKGN